MDSTATPETAFAPVVANWLRAPSHLRRPAVAEIPAGSSVPLTFLRRLAVDADLRNELEAAPAVTLARHGIQVAEDAIPAEVRLPSSQQLGSTLREFATSESQSLFDRFWGFLGGVPSD